jgi:hypothetical protein
MSRPDNRRFRLPSDTIPALERAFMNFEAMEERLVEAMAVLIHAGDREHGWLHAGTLAMWRQYKPDIVEADDRPLRTCGMTRAEVERAEEVLGWMNAAVPAGVARRVMGVALLKLARGDRARVEWQAVKATLARAGVFLSANGARMQYNRAITAICEWQNARTSAA